MIGMKVTASTKGSRAGRNGRIGIMTLAQGRSGIVSSLFLPFGHVAMIVSLALVAMILGANPAASEEAESNAIRCLALTIYFEARGEIVAGAMPLGMCS